MGNPKFDKILKKVEELDKTQAQNIIKASLSMGVSPDDLEFWNQVCEAIREIEDHSVRDFLETLAGDINADALIQGAGACRGMGGCRGMGACRGMGGCAMEGYQYDIILTKAGAIGLLNICILYNLTPIDLALCWIQCPQVTVANKRDMKTLKILANKINVELAHMPVPPRPPTKAASTKAKVSKRSSAKGKK